MLNTADWSDAIRIQKIEYRPIEGKMNILVLRFDAQIKSKRVTLTESFSRFPQNQRFISSGRISLAEIVYNRI